VSLGAIEFDTGRYKEAEQYYRQALEVKQAWYGPDHPETASAQTMLGRALVYQKRYEEARSLLEKALATQTRVFGEKHTRVASTLNDLGNIFVAEQKWAEAEQCYRRMEDAYRASRGDEHYLVATALSNRANVYLRQGQAAKAEKMLRDVVARYTRALSPEHVNTGIARIRLGRSLVRQKLWREAAGETRAGYEILQRQAKAPVSWLQGAREDLAVAYAALGDRAEADRFQRELSAGK
jgi:serine/threonine-protein kinase